MHMGNEGKGKVKNDWKLLFSTRRVELPSTEVGKAADKTSLDRGYTRSLFLDQFLRCLLRTQMEISNRQLDIVSGPQGHPGSLIH